MIFYRPGQCASATIKPVERGGMEMNDVGKVCKLRMLSLGTISLLP